MELSKIKLIEKRVKRNLELSLRNVGDMALKRRARYIVEHLDPKNGDRILDIGCGNGYYLSLLNRLGIKLELVGIDIDVRALKDANKFIGDKKVKLILADAGKIPFKKDSFDKVIMSEVVEHVKDDSAVLKEAARVLKKGGILTLTTCNIDYPFMWDPINWILQHFFNTHIKSGFWAGIWNNHERLYKKTHIEKLVKQANLRIEISNLLTFWCLPFNHHIVNFIARLLAVLFYSNKLPKKFAGGMIKFKNEEQALPVRLIFYLVNTYDRLNDIFFHKGGVSIFIKADK